MTQLLSLIRNLKAFTIVIIENAFIYEENYEKILAKFCFLPGKNRSKIIKGLEASQLQSFAEELMDFYSKFVECERDLQLESAMPASEYFKKYLLEIKASELKEDEVIKQIEDVFANDEDNKLKDLFLKYGIYSSVNEAGYEELIKLISELEDASILIYKSQPSHGEVDNFFKEIDETSLETQSDFCLAIIDKKLSTGDSENEGKSFIQDSIIPKNDKDTTKIICCLYTSQPENDLPLESFSDYFIQEIGKDDPNKYEKITKTLTRSAYAQVFNTIKTQYQKSAENALNTVLKNQKNIKYIIEHSHKEGINGIEAIKYWFNLAHLNQLELEDIGSLEFFSGIISFFDNKHLDNHPQIGKIGSELKELNSFELFDKNINNKYLPIGPGDIWKINDEYYILMGQLCDLLIRNDNSRNAKFGELLKVELTDLPTTDEKFSVQINSGRKLIHIQNFPIGHEAYKSIIIDISTNTTEFADLSSLDLAMFNTDGHARLDLREDAVSPSFKVLPPNFSKYYEELREKYISLRAISEAVDITSLINKNIKFSELNFLINDESVLSHPFVRVARLKGRFYDSVYNNFLNNKGRIDLNLIDNAPEHVSKVLLSCFFKHDEESNFELETANLWAKSGKLYFKRDELVDSLPSLFKQIFQTIPPLLEVGSQTQFDLVQIDTTKFNLELKFLVSAGVFQGKSHYSYKALFSEQKPLTNPNFRVAGEDVDISFLDEEGRATRALSVEELKKGVLVYEKNVMLQFVDGILNRTEISE
jgi:hypothetical protein